MLEKPADLEKVRHQVPFPVFVKAREVTSWRNEMGGALKGFVANTPEELAIQVDGLLAERSGGVGSGVDSRTRYQPLQGLLLRARRAERSCVLLRFESFDSSRPASALAAS